MTGSADGGRSAPGDAGRSDRSRPDDATADWPAHERTLERYRAAVEALDDGVYVLDADNRFRLVNDALCALTGYDREALLGAHATKLVDEDALADVDRRHAALTNGERVAASVAVTLDTADGRRVPVETRFVRFRVDGGLGRRPAGFWSRDGNSWAMVESVGERYVELEPEDFYLLSGVEHGMRFAEWVRRDRLPDLTGLDEESVGYRLDRCLDRELVERRTIQYEGYRLRAAGYDALALRAFAERDTVEGFGAPLGVGKESDVYEVRSYKPLALKFHREGYTNFREVRREREYTADREHVSWLYTARKAAEKEYAVLEALYPTVSVPRPVDQNRHAIVMDQMDGVELSRSRLDPDQVVGVLDLVLDELEAAYASGWVHADMSEYNVFVGAEGVTVFDWPQAVPTDHRNAGELLDRDVENVVRYFRRKYPGALPDVDADAVAAAIADGSFEGVRTAEAG